MPRTEVWAVVGEILSRAETWVHLHNLPNYWSDILASLFVWRPQQIFGCLAPYSGTADSSKSGWGKIFQCQLLNSFTWFPAVRCRELSHSTSTCYNIYPIRCNITQFILSGNCSTYFGWYHRPSSGAQTTVSTASGICHTVTAICRYRGRVGTVLSVL